jgi:hypothetical protein
MKAGRSSLSCEIAGEDPDAVVSGRFLSQRGKEILFRRRRDVILSQK